MDEQMSHVFTPKDEEREPWEDEPDPERQRLLANVLDAVEEATHALNFRGGLRMPADLDDALRTFIEEVVQSMEAMERRTGLPPTNNDQTWRMLEIAKRGEWEQAMVIFTLAGIRWREGLSVGQYEATDPGPTAEELEGMRIQAEYEVAVVAAVRDLIAGLPNQPRQPAAERADSVDDPLARAATPQPNIVPIVVSPEALERQVGPFGTDAELRHSFLYLNTLDVD